MLGLTERLTSKFNMAISLRRYELRRKRNEKLAWFGRLEMKWRRRMKLIRNGASLRACAWLMKWHVSDAMADQSLLIRLPVRRRQRSQKRSENDSTCSSKTVDSLAHGYRETSVWPMAFPGRESAYAGSVSLLYVLCCVCLPATRENGNVIRYIITAGSENDQLNPGRNSHVVALKITKAMSMYNV